MSPRSKPFIYGLNLILIFCLVSQTIQPISIALASSRDRASADWRFTDSQAKGLVEPPQEEVQCETLDFQSGTYSFMGVQSPWATADSFHVPGQGWTSDFFPGYGYRIAIEGSMQPRRILSTTVRYTPGNYPNGAHLWTQLYNGDTLVEATYPEAPSGSTEYTTTYDPSNGLVDKIWVYRYPALEPGDPSPAYIRSLTLCFTDLQPPQEEVQCESLDFQSGMHGFIGVQANWATADSFYAPGQGWTSDFFPGYGYRIAIERSMQPRRVLSTTVRYTPGSHPGGGYIWTELYDGDTRVEFTHPAAPPGSTEYTTTYASTNGLVDKILIHRYPATVPGDPAPAYIRSLTLCFTEPELPQVGVLEVNPKVVEFSLVEGADNLAPQDVVISNSGTGPLNWTAGEAIDWLNLSSISGTAPASVTVSINAASLSAGIYTGQITIEGQDAQNSPQVVQVKLTVLAPPDTEGEKLWLPYIFYRWLGK